MNKMNKAGRMSYIAQTLNLNMGTIETLDIHSRARIAYHVKKERHPKSYFEYYLKLAAGSREIEKGYIPYCAWIYKVCVKGRGFNPINGSPTESDPSFYKSLKKYLYNPNEKKEEKKEETISLYDDEEAEELKQAKKAGFNDIASYVSACERQNGLLDIAMPF